MTAPAGPSRQSRKAGTKGKEARRMARERYRATHGSPGSTRAAENAHARRTGIMDAAFVAEIDEDTLADFTTWTRDELRKAAAEKGIEGRGRMSKDELVKAVTEAYA